MQTFKILFLSKLPHGLPSAAHKPLSKGLYKRGAGAWLYLVINTAAAKTYATRLMLPGQALKIYTGNKEVALYGF